MEQVKHYIISGESVDKLREQVKVNEKANNDAICLIIKEAAFLGSADHIRTIERFANMGRDIEVREAFNEAISWVLDNIEEAGTDPAYTTYNEQLDALAVFKAMDDDSAGEDEWTRAYRAGKLAGAIDIVSNVFGFTTRRIKADLEGMEE